MNDSWLAHPWVLWLLAVTAVPGILRFLASRRARRAMMQMGGYAPAEPWRSLKSTLRFLRNLWRSTAITLIVLGIAGPQWGREWGQSGTSGRDIVVVLDLSRSMYARDGSVNRVKRAEEAIRDLIENHVRKKGGYRVALILFAAEVKVACPLTHDIDHFLEVLARLDLEQPPPDLLPTSETASGTRIGAGLTKAVELHEPLFKGSQDIVLFSDGDDPARDAVNERMAAVNIAVERRIPVHVVGIGDPTRDVPLPFDYGTENATRLREGPLKDIALSTAGTYTPLHPGKAIRMGKLFEESMSGHFREREDKAIPVYRQRYVWFFASAVLMIVLDYLMGVQWLRVLDYLMGIQWLRSDRQR